MFGADSLVTITSNSQVRNMTAPEEMQKASASVADSWIALNVGLYFSTENVCASVV